MIIFLFWLQLSLVPSKWLPCAQQVAAIICSMPEKLLASQPTLFNLHNLSDAALWVQRVAHDAGEELGRALTTSEVDGLIANAAFESGCTVQELRTEVQLQESMPIG